MNYVKESVAGFFSDDNYIGKLSCTALVPSSVSFPSLLLALSLVPSSTPAPARNELFLPFMPPPFKQTESRREEMEEYTETDREQLMKAQFCDDPDLHYGRTGKTDECCVNNDILTDVEAVFQMYDPGEQESFHVPVGRCL